MNKQDWKLLQQAFTAAANLSDAEQAEYVAGFAASNPQLGQALRDLLAADQANDEAIVRPIAATAEAFAEGSTDPWLGREVGHWRINERIGGGGMGAVFLAERADEQYAQTVALKVMMANLQLGDSMARFRVERQILASLDHPNIATLIDGGSTEEGLPYLVMDYVDGSPVDSYCDAQSLSIDDRLRLFQRICRAVDYAHRSLVVHRDLKPSNILINEDGEPILLDFGIAKLLESDAQAHTVAVTRAGTRAMTPEYASPEQVRGEPVTVATDVYALGILLYRLMTGSSPYGDAPTTPREYEIAILDHEPEKPSTIVTADDASIGEQRSTSTDRLRKRLTGDLDNIVLKALQKEPERRYATASDLTADIERYLAHEPIEARGNHWTYKTRKFVVRHIRGLSVALLVVLTIAALVTFYTARLADERDRATLAAQQSKEVSDFLTSLFESASPHESKGEPVTAVELLHQGRERIEELQDQPELQTNLMGIMAGSLTALGEYDESIEFLQRALEMREASAEPDPVALSVETHRIAEVLRQRGRLEEAEHYERRTLAIATAEFGETHSNTAYILSRLGVILFDARRVDEALVAERKALEYLIANGDGQSSMAIDVRGNIVNALSWSGQMREAEVLARETVELSRTVDGDLAPNTIIRYANLGLILNKLGKAEEALEVFEACLRDGVNIWPENHNQLDFMAARKAESLRLLGRHEEAMLTLQRAMATARERDGEDNRRYVSYIQSMGRVMQHTGDLDGAKTMLDSALEKALAIGGEEDRYVARILLALGTLENQRGNLVAAEDYLRRSFVNEQLLGSIRIQNLSIQLGDVLSKNGVFEEATAWLESGIAGMEASFGEHSAMLHEPYQIAVAHFARAGDEVRSQRYAAKINSLTSP